RASCGPAALTRRGAHFRRLGRRFKLEAIEETGMTLSPQFAEGQFFFGAEITSDTDLSPLLAATTSPLRLNFRNVVNINSGGVRKLYRLATELRGKQVEFHECRRVVIDLINVM